MEAELKKTLIPITLGAVAGLISFLVTQDLRQRDAFGIIILVLLIYVQKFIFPKLGIELKAKDWVGLSFLTLSSWYILWTFLLNL
ncbi:MAG: hypothetical protein HA489_00900 [Archaeoglobales archaeon]|jgi:hypothetical protein|nr:hypothetical protein [Archaeoglobales archaeon]TDA29306.1 MAG: hypothetical protein DSO00_04525 [Archaeoglobi archaeon]